MREKKKKTLVFFEKGVSFEVVKRE